MAIVKVDVVSLYPGMSEMLKKQLLLIRFKVVCNSHFNDSSLHRNVAIANFKSGCGLSSQKWQNMLVLAVNNLT